MKIGIEATSAVAAQKTGVGYYTYNLVQVLARMPQREHQYTFYVRRPHATAEAQELFGDGALKVLRFPVLWAQIRLPFEFWQAPQDVYFFPVPVLPLLYQPANSVITVHDIAFVFFPEGFSPLLRLWLNLATRLGVARAKKIIAVSEATRQDLIAYYKVPPEKIAVVHHGVHPHFHPFQFSEQAMLDAIRPKYHLHRPYVLCIGTLQRRKNIPRLLQAFYLLREKHHLPHQLVLIGQRTPDLPEQEIFAMIRRLALEQDVVWTGYVERGDLPALLNGADMFVLPSLYEGFGMPLLEAMACGIPVACSNVSSFPEVVGDAGLLFDPYNTDSIAAALYRGLTDEACRTSLVSRGIQRAAQFSWERTARQTLAVLEEVGHAS